MSNDKLSIKEIIKDVEIATFVAALVLFFMFTGVRLDVIYDNIWTKILTIVEFYVLIFYVHNLYKTYWKK